MLSYSANVAQYMWGKLQLLYNVQHVGWLPAHLNAMVRIWLYCILYCQSECLKNSQAQHANTKIHNILFNKDNTQQTCVVGIFECNIWTLKITKQWHQQYVSWRIQFSTHCFLPWKSILPDLKYMYSKGNLLMHNVSFSCKGFHCKPLFTSWNGIAVCQTTFRATSDCKTWLLPICFSAY